MTNLIDRIKTFTGRKLSQKELDRVRKNKFTSEEDKNDFSTLKLYSDGDTIVKRINKTEYATTDDHSYSNVKHTMHYFVGDDTRVYNRNGLLIRRIITKNHPAGPGYYTRDLFYDSPGSFIGEKNDRYNNVVGVTPVDEDNFMVIESGPEIENSSWDRYERYRVSFLSKKSSKPLKVTKFKIKG